MNVKRELARLRAPDEGAAQARSWGVILSGFEGRSPSVRRVRRLRLTLVLATIAFVVALTLTPAGATVRRLITHALGVPHAARAQLSLFGHSRVLVSGTGETWIVSGGGQRRRLGPWREASWSPHGIYIAVASDDQLAAVDPSGRTQWALTRRGVSDPRWYPPTGYRVAYRSGAALRVVAGDGTGDHLLARGVSAVALAWRPRHPFELAYVRRDRVVLRDADSGRVIWTRPAGAVFKLAWSSDGGRLVILARSGARVLSGAGQLTATVRAGRLTPIRDGSLSPDGRVLALVRSQGVGLARLGSSRPTLVTVLREAGMGQVAWSPRGDSLLVSWPAADEWVFIAMGHHPRIAAISRITQQFSRGRRSRAFPRLEGWCCTAQGPAG